MPHLSETPAIPPLRRLAGRLPGQALTALIGSWAVAAASWIEVPMIPVPMTMQTYMVLLVGALCGWRLAGATLALYLAQGVLGLPMFAGGAAGPQHLVGPTAGYLLAFPAAAALVGWMAERGWTRSLAGATLGLLAGHGLILAAGAVWLAGLTGWSTALAAGVVPFLAGTVLKTGLGVATLRACTRLRQAA
ncbi:biotin transporter BioY [Oleisolibacter albus]|uniref:biotin transporter BioY n=1 Tax=Oleisolibacter albus TaxID=2171757 RepID=UPI000DF39E9C|nr:biotin transporter BioY [Oleisolibacter albus]